MCFAGPGRSLSPVKLVCWLVVRLGDQLVVKLNTSSTGLEDQLKPAKKLA